MLYKRPTTVVLGRLGAGASSTAAAADLFPQKGDGHAATSVRPTTVGAGIQPPRTQAAGRYVVTVALRRPGVSVAVQESQHYNYRVRPVVVAPIFVRGNRLEGELLFPLEKQLG